MYEEEYEAKCGDGQAGYPQVDRLRIPHLGDDLWSSVIIVEGLGHGQSKSRT